MAMRRTLGTLLVTTVLATGLLSGCGSESEPTGTTSPSPSQAPSPDENGTLEFTEVAVITETGAGGEVDGTATRLTDSEAVADFSEQFENDAMETRVRAAVADADVPDGRAVVGAVVAIGCDVPPGVSVEKTDAGLVITPLKVKDPKPECFAAMTTVALVMVDAEAV
jgi:hypothetical protein